MKNLRMLGVVVAAAFFSAAPVSPQWSRGQGLSLSLDRAQAIIGRPWTPLSVAGTPADTLVVLIGPAHIITGGPTIGATGTLIRGPMATVTMAIRHTVPRPSRHRPRLWVRSGLGLGDWPGLGRRPALGLGLVAPGSKLNTLATPQVHALAWMRDRRAAGRQSSRLKLPRPRYLLSP
jgi:hypothetical protein